jgi:hypothetical protein
MSIATKADRRRDEDEVEDVNGPLLPPVVEEV